MKSVLFAGILALLTSCAPSSDSQPVGGATVNLPPACSEGFLQDYKRVTTQTAELTSRIDQRKQSSSKIKAAALELKNSCQKLFRNFTDVSCTAQNNFGPYVVRAKDHVSNCEYADATLEALR